MCCGRLLYLQLCRTHAKKCYGGLSLTIWFYRATLYECAKACSILNRKNAEDCFLSGVSHSVGKKEEVNAEEKGSSVGNTGNSIWRAENDFNRYGYAFG